MVKYEHIEVKYHPSWKEGKGNLLYLLRKAIINDIGNTNSIDGIINTLKEFLVIANSFKEFFEDE